MAVMLIFAFAIPISATEYTAPEAPDGAQDLMPVETTSFGKDLWTIVKKAISAVKPELIDSGKLCTCLVAAVICLSILNSMPGKTVATAELVGVLAVSALLLQQAGSMIRIGSDTVTELSEYGKLLLPVMTAAMAAQGGITSSAAIYVGTAVFDALLTAAISAILIPMTYAFLAVSIAGCATGQNTLDKLRSFIKWLSTWFLKIVLYIFTGYIGITGVVSGNADAAALKATKLTMSGMIPVVGGILSEASEAVLVAAGLMKSAAGVYGMLALLAIWITPFLKIGIRYILLKLTGALCETFGMKRVCALIGAFSDAMGLLLGMTSAICVMLLVSTVCFMKGVG